jgi:MFS family permease
MLSTFLANVPAGFVIVALPIYLDRVGLHPELIGTLFTISGLASSVLLVIFGLLADRYGRKPFVVIGTAFPIASYLILSATTAKPLILLASAVGGIGLASGMAGALVNSGFNALLSDKSQPRVRTALFSVAEMAWVLAALIGSLLAGLPRVLQLSFGSSYRGAYHTTFLIMAGIGVVATVVLLPLHEPRSALTRRPQWLPRASGRRIALFALTLGSIGLGTGCIVQLLPLWFHLRFHVSEAFLGPWYAAAQILAFACLVFATPISRRLGPVPFVVLTQGGGSVLLMLAAFMPTAPLAALLWVFRTGLLNSSWPVQQAYMMNIVEPDERATAASLSYACWSVASALTPPLGGALLAGGRYTLPFVIGGGCYALAIGLFYVFFHAIRPPSGQQEAEGRAIAAE